MTDDNDLEVLTLAFRKAKRSAEQYANQYNASLPSEACPGCGVDGHVPGLKCPCGYRHDKSWVILRDSEWGYEVVALNNRSIVHEHFKAEV